MRGLENQFLKTKDIKDLEAMRKMPLAVLLQNSNSRTIYRVNDTETFIDETCKTSEGRFDPFPSVAMVERTCRKYGAIVDEGKFKKVKIFPGQTGGYIGENHFYEMCRADFENIMGKTRKPKPGTSSS